MDVHGVQSCLAHSLSAEPYAGVIDAARGPTRTYGPHSDSSGAERSSLPSSELQRDERGLRLVMEGASMTVLVSTGLLPAPRRPMAWIDTISPALKTAEEAPRNSAWAAGKIALEAPGVNRLQAPN